MHGHEDPAQSYLKELKFHERLPILEATDYCVAVNPEKVPPAQPDFSLHSPHEPMVIEGMGFGTGPIRPKGTEAPKRAGSQVDRAEAPESVTQSGDRVEISHRPLQEAEGVDAKAQRRDGELLDDARVSEIRERIASGFYETDEVLKAILSGLELDEPTLFS